MPTAITDSNSFPGECGGSFSYTIDYNETTGNFNGSLSFNSYNDCIGTMNGAITFYGSDTSATLSMSFLALSYTGASDSVTMSGNISFTTLPSSITESITMSMDFRDNNTGETYRIKDMTMEVTTSALTESTIVKSGQVYHPDYGYVDVSTTSPILVNKDALNPHAGVLVMAGDGSTATVTFVNSNQYTIEVDVDNVAPPEVTKNCTWVPDVCN